MEKEVYKTIRLENKLNNLAETANLLTWQDASTDLVLCMLGKQLGEGVYRSVYEYNLDPKYVIKIEPRNTECNMSEYMLWDEIRGLKNELAWVKDWFAPIKYISPNGKILVMERAYEKPQKERPRKVPKFFSDCKRDNWGWIGNKFVCYDYGFLHRFIKYENKFKTIPKDAWW